MDTPPEPPGGPRRDQAWLQSLIPPILTSPLPPALRGGPPLPGEVPAGEADNALATWLAEDASFASYLDGGPAPSPGQGLQELPAPPPATPEDDVAAGEPGVSGWHVAAMASVATPTMGQPRPPGTSSEDTGAGGSATEDDGGVEPSEAPAARQPPPLRREVVLPPLDEDGDVMLDTPPDVGQVVSHLRHSATPPTTLEAGVTPSDDEEETEDDFPSTLPAGEDSDAQDVFLAPTQVLQAPPAEEDGEEEEEDEEDSPAFDGEGAAAVPVAPAAGEAQEDAVAALAATEEEDGGTPATMPRTDGTVSLADGDGGGGGASDAEDPPPGGAAGAVLLAYGGGQLSPRRAVYRRGLGSIAVMVGFATAVALFLVLPGDSVDTALAQAPVAGLHTEAMVWPPPWRQEPLTEAQAVHVARLCRVTAPAYGPALALRLGAPAPLPVLTRTSQLPPWWISALYAPADVMGAVPSTAHLVAEDGLAAPPTEVQRDAAARRLARGRGEPAAGEGDIITLEALAADLAARRLLTAEPGSAVERLALGAGLDVGGAAMGPEHADRVRGRGFVDAVRAVAHWRDEAALTAGMELLEHWAGGLRRMRATVGAPRSVRHVTYVSGTGPTPGSVQHVRDAKKGLPAMALLELDPAGSHASISLALGRGHGGPASPEATGNDMAVAAIVAGHLQRLLGEAGVALHGQVADFTVAQEGGAPVARPSLEPRPFTLQAGDMAAVAAALKRAVQLTLHTTTLDQWEAAGGALVPGSNHTIDHLLVDCMVRLQEDGYFVARTFGGDMTATGPLLELDVPLEEILHREGLLLSVDVGVDILPDDAIAGALHWTPETLETMAMLLDGQVVLRRHTYGLLDAVRGHITVPDVPQHRFDVDSALARAFIQLQPGLVKVYDKHLARGAAGACQQPASPLEHSWHAEALQSLSVTAPVGKTAARRAMANLRCAAAMYRRCATAPGSTLRMELVLEGPAAMEWSPTQLLAGVLDAGLLSYSPALSPFKAALAAVAEAAADSVEAQLGMGTEADMALLRHADIAHGLLAHAFVTGTGRVRDLGSRSAALPWHLDHAVARACLLRLTGAQNGPEAMGLGTLSGFTVAATTMSALTDNVGAFGADTVGWNAAKSLVQRHMVRRSPARADAAASTLAETILAGEALAAVALGGTTEVQALVAQHPHVAQQQAPGTPLLRYRAAAFTAAAAGAALAEFGGGVLYDNLHVHDVKTPGQFPGFAEPGHGHLRGTVGVDFRPGHTRLPLRPSVVVVARGGVSVPIQPQLDAASSTAEVLAAGIFGAPRAVGSATVLAALEANAFTTHHVHAASWRDMARTVITHVRRVARMPVLKTGDDVFTSRHAMPLLLERLLGNGSAAAMEAAEQALASHLETAGLTVLPLPDEGGVFYGAQLEARTARVPALSAEAAREVAAVMRHPACAGKVQQRRRELTVLHLRPPQSTRRARQAAAAITGALDVPLALLQLRFGHRSTWPGDAGRQPLPGMAADVAVFHPLAAVQGREERAGLLRNLVGVLPSVLGAPACQPTRTMGDEAAFSPLVSSRAECSATFQWPGREADIVSSAPDPAQVEPAQAPVRGVMSGIGWAAQLFAPAPSTGLVRPVLRQRPLGQVTFDLADNGGDDAGAEAPPRRVVPVPPAAAGNDSGSASQRPSMGLFAAAAMRAIGNQGSMEFDETAARKSAHALRMLHAREARRARRRRGSRPHATQRKQDGEWMPAFTAGTWMLMAAGEGQRSDAVPAQVVGVSSAGVQVQYQSAAGDQQALLPPADAQRLLRPMGALDMAPPVQRQRLSRRALFDGHMRSRGFSLRNVHGDGACLFRAVAVQVYGHEQRHQELRDAVVAYMRERPLRYANVVEHGQTFEQYLTAMGQQGQYAGATEIGVLEEVLDRPIRVFADYGVDGLAAGEALQPLAQGPLPDDELAAAGRLQLHVAYVHGNHYMAMHANVRTGEHPAPLGEVPADAPRLIARHRQALLEAGQGDSEDAEASASDEVVEVVETTGTPATQPSVSVRARLARRAALASSRTPPASGAGAGRLQQAAEHASGALQRPRGTRRSRRQAGFEADAAHAAGLGCRRRRPRSR